MLIPYKVNTIILIIFFYIHLMTFFGGPTENGLGRAPEVADADAKLDLDIITCGTQAIVDSSLMHPGLRI